MKRFLFFLVAALLCTSAVIVYGKRPAGLDSTQDKKLTVIVMDTTHALLNDATVKCGKNVRCTSFDGRVVLEPQHLAGVKKIVVSSAGCQSRKVKLGDEKELIVVLTPKIKKAERKGEVEADVYYTLGASSKSSARYYRSAPHHEACLAAELDAPGIISDNMSAGRLTAGEVNDFAKWYFWHKVIDGSHKQFVRTWQIAPYHRYTVQVKTSQGTPVAGRAVCLLDQQGNTLFQAVTDNTGKAEVWAQLIADSIGIRPSQHQIRVDNRIQPAAPWSEGLNTIVVEEPCEMSDAVDVVFVFDATGSMGDELRYLQAEMQDVIARAKEATGGLKMRTGAVVYRDHGDEYLTRISRLTDDIKTTQTFINKQEADGGGDFPEAVPEALMATINSVGWNMEARTRVAFLVLDAPCHEDSATLVLLHEQILNAAALGVRIVPVVCSGLDKSGELLMRAIALVTNGTSFFLTDDSGIGHSHLQPTTDSLKVERLNDMLVRTIVEFSIMPSCEAEVSDEGVNESFLPNPFDAQDIATVPTTPHGKGVVYVVDVTGKLLSIYEADMENVQASLRDQLPVGVYFLKTFMDGQWYTKKVVIQ